MTEALGVEEFDRVEETADVVQIGARNMQNFPLLRRAGQARKPIFLKRMMSATLEEFLLAAEYIMAEGNNRVILCERGIRTFSDHSRYTLDINIVPELKRLSHLPVFVDPSHAAGRREIVVPLALAVVGRGRRRADGRSPSRSCECAFGRATIAHDRPVRRADASGAASYGARPPGQGVSQ